MNLTTARIKTKRIKVKIEKNNFDNVKKLDEKSFVSFANEINNVDHDDFKSNFSVISNNDSDANVGVYNIIENKVIIFGC
jgi:hypothetical protein